MQWTDDLRQAVNYGLVSVGGQAITLKTFLGLALVLLVTFYLARWFRNFLERRLPAHLDAGARYTITRLSQYAVGLTGFFVGLKVLHIDLTGLAVVAGALGLGLGFGLQNAVGNFVAGMILLFERPGKVGDRISIENLEGNVLDIKFRTTTIVTNDNISVIVPNSEFVNEKVIHWSHGGTRVRIHVPVGWRMDPISLRSRTSSWRWRGRWKGCSSTLPRKSGSTSLPTRPSTWSCWSGPISPAIIAA